MYIRDIGHDRCVRIPLTGRIAGLAVAACAQVRGDFVMARVLMLASFGLEIVECGGALARHVQAEDYVHAVVLLSRPESRPQVREAADILGIKDVEFLMFPYGDWTVNIPWKERIVEISGTFELKQKALAVLSSQMAFSAQMIEEKTGSDLWCQVVTDLDEMGEDKVKLGLALHRQFDMALALVNGLAGHSDAVMGEAYRREGSFLLDRLVE